MRLNRAPIVDWRIYVTLPYLRDRLSLAPCLESGLPSSLSLCLILLLFASPGLADTGVSPGAPQITFYAGIGEDCCGEDPHPVHGIQSPDGGYLAVGKSADNGGNIEGFVVKVAPPTFTGTLFLSPEETNTYQWSATFGSTGKMDGANSVAATDSAAFVGGFEERANGTVDRLLAKYDLVTGSLLWATTLGASSKPCRSNACKGRH